MGYLCHGTRVTQPFIGYRIGRASCSVREKTHSRRTLLIALIITMVRPKPSAHRALRQETVAALTNYCYLLCFLLFDTADLPPAGCLRIKTRMPCVALLSYWGDWVTCGRALGYGWFSHHGGLWVWIDGSERRLGHFTSLRLLTYRNKG